NSSLSMLFTPAAFLGCLAACSALQGKDAMPVQKGLVVHEWGVFRVHNDMELANADMRAIWEGLPKFVYGQVTGRSLPRHWHNVEIVDRPVIFFHAAQPVECELRIDFPRGMPGVWWPGSQRPAIRHGQVTG